MNKTLWALLLAVPCLAQDHIVVPIADAGRPVTMNIKVMHGSVTIKAYSGKEVIVDIRGGSGSAKEAPVHEGLRQIYNSSSELSIESENNSVTISQPGGGREHGSELMIQTPVNTSLKVKTLNGGSVTIEGLNGDIEAQNLNGAVAVKNVSGSVVAHSLNGAVTVGLTRAASGKAMSFSSLNGTVDVTLPADLKGNLSMKTNHGEIYSDFDLKLQPSPKPVTEDTGAKSGRYRVHMDGMVSGTVNGGGPDFQFTTLNGNIYIRKAK